MKRRKKYTCEIKNSRLSFDIMIKEGMVRGEGEKAFSNMNFDSNGRIL
jgi:hypothetical protein